MTNDTFTFTAWDLIGFDGHTDSMRHDDRFAHLPQSVAMVRIHGGRATYDAVHFNDDGRQSLVHLLRLDTSGGDLSFVRRAVDPGTMLDLVLG